MMYFILIIMTVASTIVMANSEAVNRHMMETQKKIELQQEKSKAEYHPYNYAAPQDEDVRDSSAITTGVIMEPEAEPFPNDYNATDELGRMKKGSDPSSEAVQDVNLQREYASEQEKQNREYINRLRENMQKAGIKVKEKPDAFRLSNPSGSN